MTKIRLKIDTPRAVLIQGFNKRGLPAILVNWKHRPLGTRERPMRWVFQGESYGAAIKRVYCERIYQLGLKIK